VTIGARAVHHAARVAAAVTVGFLVGRYAFDDAQTATYAALTPIALLVLGEVGGSAATRLRAYAAALATAAVLVVIGTVVSERTVAAGMPHDTTNMRISARPSPVALGPVLAASDAPSATTNMRTEAATVRSLTTVPMTTSTAAVASAAA